MSLRFWRQFKIAPGVTLNLSKSGPSVSIGPRGAKFTIGPGGRRVTVGLPGTALYYTKVLREDAQQARREAPTTHAVAGAGSPPTANREPEPTLLPADQEALAAALDALREGREGEALERVRCVVHVADAAFIGGILALRRSEDHAEEARALLTMAVNNAPQLGHGFRVLGEDLKLDIPITENVRVVLKPDQRGAALALVEALQRLGRVADGLQVLRELAGVFPGDPLVQLSLDDLEGSP